MITQAARAAMELDERMKQAVAGSPLGLGIFLGLGDPRISKVRERRVWRARILENWKIGSFEWVNHPFDHLDHLFLWAIYTISMRNK